MSTRPPLSSGLVGTLLAAAMFVSIDASAQQRGCITFLTTRQNVDFDKHIQPIFDRHCVSCHQPGGQDYERSGLDLRPGRSHGALVGVRSALDPAWTLVTPFDPDHLYKSLLFYMVACETPPVGRRMPPIGGLTVDEQILLESWIYRGAAPGAAGTIRQIPIQYGLSGTWVDLSAPGQGFSFEIVPQNPPLFVAYWLTYNLGANPLPAISPQGQRWLLAIGNYTSGGASVVLDVRLQHGGLFDFDLAPTSESIGSATLTFHSCTEATLRYTLKLDGDDAQQVERSVALRRLTPYVSCQEAGKVD